MAVRKLRLVEDADGDTTLAARPERKRGTMKIAFTTQDMKTVDAHFASARNIAVYEVDDAGYRFLEAMQFDNTSNEEGKHTDDGEDRIAAKIGALDGCAILFVKAIGGPAAAKVVAARVHPIKVPEPEPITQVLDRTVAMLKGTPPPWLRKALGKTDERDLSFLDEED
ncbi:nitrogen fixation protein NifX [Caenispirillum salinarum]|uniref:nitrogen fixation protein NifX n=1 Tax=Caenispirillum salinarum TaxID=859058 RepID=UPI00384A7DBC